MLKMYLLLIEIDLILSQNIKKSFDPKRILNPGKMYTEYINGNSFFKRTIKR